MFISHDYRDTLKLTESNGMLCKGGNQSGNLGYSLKMPCSNAKYMQIVVNDLKHVHPPVWSFVKGCSNVLDTDRAHCIPALRSARSPTYRQRNSIRLPPCDPTPE